MTRRWETALLAVAFALAGLVVLALAYAGPATYADIATHEGFARVEFREHDGSRRTMALPELLAIHDGWVRYITGRGGPSGGTVTVDFFTPDEQAHMADVRRVFMAFEFAALIAVATAVFLGLRAAKRSPAAASLLVRDAAIAAGIATAIVAVAAALAFDPLFLLFHEVFFPQGNFLFGPDSNLLAMYPDPYWYGVTLRVGLTFVAAMAVIAIAASATLRRARR
jgi:integral membrane protein (TIGR01906 family)